MRLDHPRKGYILTSLILGIVSFILSVFPQTAFFIALAGLLFGLNAYNYVHHKLALAGIFICLVVMFMAL